HVGRVRHEILELGRLGDDGDVGRQRDRGDILGDDPLHLCGIGLALGGIQRVLELGEDVVQLGIGVALAVIGALGAVEDAVDRIGGGDPAAVQQVVVTLVARLAIGDAGLVVGLGRDADGLQLGDDDLLGQLVIGPAGLDDDAPGKLLSILF